LYGRVSGRAGDVGTTYFKEVTLQMKVTEVGQRFRCRLCGNEVEVTKVGGGELVCCGEAMELMEE